MASLSIAERERKWREQLAPDYKPRTWLVEEDARPLAFLTCGPARDDDVSEATGEVYALYQEEFASGTGVARLLMAHALEDLRAEGARVAILWVLDRNLTARRFYEIAGWREDGTTKTSQAREGVRCEVRYARSLV